MSFLRMLMTPLLVLGREPTEAKALIEQLLSPRVRVRRDAIEALAEHIPSTGDLYVPELLQALLDTDGDVRACAAHLLGQMGPKAALATSALARALNDPQEDVRTAAAYALGRIGAEDNSLVPVLLRQMLDRDDAVRVAVIQALGALGPYAKDAIPALLEALQRPQWEERWSAAIALGQIGHPRPLPILHQRFYHEDDAHVRVAILDAIVLLGDGQPAWVAVFLDGLEDEDEDVRLQAAQALATWGPTAMAAAPHLCDRLPEETSLQVRPAILYAIGQIGDPDSVPHLIAALDELDIDFTYAMELWMALGRLGGADAIEPLLEGIEDTEPSLRGRAALALGRTGQATQEVVDALQTLREDKDYGVQLQATQALARLDQDAAAIASSMGEATVFWAARNWTTMTGMLPLPQDRLDDALLLLPGTQECEHALEELDFAIEWLQRHAETIKRRTPQHGAQADATADLLTNLAAQVDTAQRYLQHQPLAAPGGAAGKRMQQLRERLADLHKQLNAADSPTWHAQLEEALFE